jgi:anaerobic dimethyl sulfoxide reductase subunit B (iron-sulfur subunit)
MTQMGFFFDQTRCTGCYACQVACKDWHDIEAGPVNWMKLLVIEAGKYPSPFLAYLTSPCYHCANPACATACPADAIAKRETDGIVVVDRERCVGQDECGALCLKACPWDAPQFDDSPNAKMQKCDLCIDRLEAGVQPICVEGCPMFALDAGPIEELRKRHVESVEASGFRYTEKIGPSVTFKGKKSK